MQKCLGYLCHVKTFCKSEKVGHTIGVLSSFFSICIAGRLNCNLYAFKRSSDEPTMSGSGGDS